MYFDPKRAEVKNFNIHIARLPNGMHHFDFDVNQEFFEHYGKVFLTDGRFHVGIDIEKQERLLEADFTITGVAHLICDRSLDPFDFPVEMKKRIIFKYGETDEEISDEVVMINSNSQSLDSGQYIYEFITLAIPMKKLHPRFNGENENEEPIVYSSGAEKMASEGDPRWDILKKLK